MSEKISLLSGFIIYILIHEYIYSNNKNISLKLLNVYQ